MHPALILIDMQRGMSTPEAGQRNNPGAEQAMAKEALRIVALQPEGSLVRSNVEAAMRGVLGAGTEG